MDIRQVSTDCVLITFGNVISKDISLKVQNAFLNIKKLNSDGITQIIPSYTSILVGFDIFLYKYDDLKKLLEDTLSKSNTNVHLSNKEIIQIDVYYGLEVGIDLEKISIDKKISIDEIVELHSSKIYDVYAIGFLAGFAFLGIVDKKIASARLSTPRKKVLKGSVGIADNQTAVYPKDSAGGWNIIGNTTKQLFDKSLKELSLFSIGKQVKFNPITKKQYLAQGGEL